MTAAAKVEAEAEVEATEQPAKTLAAVKPAGTKQKIKKHIQ